MNIQPIMGGTICWLKGKLKLIPILNKIQKINFFLKIIFNVDNYCCNQLKAQLKAFWI